MLIPLSLPITFTYLFAFK